MKRILISAALALGLLGAVQAQSLSDGWSRATWTVNFAVTDLDATDGVDAAMHAFRRDYFRDDVVNGGVLYGYEQLVAPTFRLAGDSVSGHIGYYSLLMEGNDVLTDTLYFELTPRTRLTVTGTLLAAAVSPIDNVGNCSLYHAVVTCERLTTNMFAGLDISLGLDPSKSRFLDYPNLGHPYYGYQNPKPARLLDLVSTHLAVEGNDSLSRTFEMAIETVDPDGMTFDFLAVARAGGTGSRSYQTVVTIPEPGTVSLLLLGLPLLCARRLGRHAFRGMA